MESEYIIVSLGGSLVVPEGVDAVFVKSFKRFIEEHVSLGFRFVVVVGGGRTARLYQEALTEIATPTKEDKDVIGISATRINAETIRIVLGPILAGNTIITDPTLSVVARTPVIVAGGWKPGWSTDYVAAYLAKEFGAKRLVNLSNIDYAYDKDPNLYKDAQIIKEISWPEFREIIPREWDPGIHAPFDPVASKLAEKERLEVAIVNGRNLETVSDYLLGKPFVGTVIK